MSAKTRISTGCKKYVAREREKEKEKIVFLTTRLKKGRKGRQIPSIRGGRYSEIQEEKEIGRERNNQYSRENITQRRGPMTKKWNLTQQVYPVTEQMCTWKVTRFTHVSRHRPSYRQYSGRM